MIELPELPYSKDALAPHISAQTLDFHHGKHHQAYVTKTKELIKGTPLENQNVEQIIMACANKQSEITLFNNAAQVWNHTFFWNCLAPKAAAKPDGILLEKLLASFGSIEKFKEEFKAAALAQFGSGWAWLIQDGDKLKITKTSNAQNPMADGQKALFTVDVWEHAYYLDFQNRRADFVGAVLDNLVNWNFVAGNLA
jgi:superoxide dismutase, Fe-Mn family